MVETEEAPEVPHQAAKPAPQGTVNPQMEVARVKEEDPDMHLGHRQAVVITIILGGTKLGSV